MTGRLHTCYSPVRRSPAVEASFNPAAPRLACVKPVASVHPEPGSNSSLLLFLFFFFILKRQWPQRVLSRISYPFTEAGFFQELTPSSSFATLGGYFFSSCTFLSLSIVILSMFSGFSSALLSAALGLLRFSHRRKNFAKVIQIFVIPKFLLPFFCNSFFYFFAFYIALFSLMSQGIAIPLKRVQR